MNVFADAGLKLGWWVRQRLRALTRVCRAASGGFGLDPAAPAIRKAAMASMQTNACRLTEAPR